MRFRFAPLVNVGAKIPGHVIRRNNPIFCSVTFKKGLRALTGTRFSGWAAGGA